ncbi:macrolide family glycosyltransferase [Streptomyces orinoci]|uniref:Macrolide family glycosyltransferase n=1 Tax=Streptomyces orinoci TaxID=67339 RepID=A0ABV3JYY4_STRON|nr:macrolide family glycosyltransferase [Streptomyces orinoci]
MPRPAHIAIVSIPAFGHVYPALALVQELVARGHRVSYVNAPWIAPVIEPTGADFIPYDTVVSLDPKAMLADRVAAMNLFLTDAIRQLPQLHAAFAEDRPDVVLYDHGSFGARVLAEQLGIPAVQLAASYVPWKGAVEDGVPVFGILPPMPGAEEYYERFAKWLQDSGITAEDGGAPDPREFVTRAGRVLSMAAPVMQPHPDRVDQELVTHVGPCLGDRSAQGSWQRPAQAEKLLLVSFGSVFTDRPDFYRECLLAFGGLPGWHVVLQTGKLVDRAALGRIPDNIEVHSWVPQLAVLEQADAFVTHGGMGGVNEGLYCGVPMIAVPQAADQFINADRLAELGVGRRIDTEEATAERLRTALLELTADPRVAERLAGIRRELRQLGGTARAADLVEAYLPGHR